MSLLLVILPPGSDFPTMVTPLDRFLVSPSTSHFLLSPIMVICAIYAACD